MSAHKTLTFQALLECYCPKGCGFYYLMGAAAGGALLRYPSAGSYRVRNPYQPPSAAPPGQYVLRFLRNPTDQRTVPHVNAPSGHLVVTVGGADGATAQVLRAELPQRKQFGSAPRGAVARPRSPGKRYEDDPTAPDPPEDESLRQAQIDATISRLTLTEELREGRVIRAGAVTDDLIDALRLNSHYRHDLQDLTHGSTRLSVHHFDTMGRTLKLVEQLQDSLGRQVEFSLAQIEKLATPPAPPDYNPSIVAGLNMVRDISVAFAQRRGRRRKKRPLPAASTATSQVQEQVTSTATPTVIAASTQTHETNARPPATLSKDVPSSAAASTQPKQDSIPAAMIDAVMDTLRAAKVPGTSQDRSPPLVAPVPAVSVTEPTLGTPAQPNARAPLLDRKTTEEVAAVLSELLHRKKSEPSGPR